ncbi:phenylalanine--tRNA ligase subunit alpha [soil metagenome]
MSQALPADPESLLDEGRERFAAAPNLDELDAVKASLVGRRGALTAVQRTLRKLDERQRRDLGARINAVRAALAELEEQRRAVLTDERDRVVLAAEAVDVTLPARTPRRGSLHPVHETIEAMVDVMAHLGFTAVEGPEVETDWFNFQAMNIPVDHPARGMHDTIYVQPPNPADPPGSVLLRTHTSPMQTRIMLAQGPPVYIAVPGRTYRQETADATHLPVFHQMECLAVDEGLSFADLRGTLAELCRGLFGPGARIRMRPDHYPFTEPSADVDAWVPAVGDWLELLGSGMVHPNVLRMAGYDPEQVSGFAFGMGVERVAMLRHGIDDLRLFADNDLRFLSSF